MNSLEFVQTIVNEHTIPPFLAAFLGGLFALVDLGSKYPTTQNYLFRVTASYVYIFIAAIGAMCVAYAMRVFGVSFSADYLLNIGILSLLSAGLFLGITSIVALPASVDPQLGIQLKTLRDLVFSYLSGTINRKMEQHVLQELRKLRIIDPDSFREEAESILESITLLGMDEKKKLSAKFVDYIVKTRYEVVIIELTKYRDFDFLMERFSDEKIQVDAWVDKLENEEHVKKTLGVTADIVAHFLHKKQPPNREMYAEIYSEVYYCLSEYADKDSKFDVAEKYYTRAFELTQKTHKQALYSGCLGRLALKLNDPNWSEASKWFHKELSLVENSSHKNLIAEAKHGFARIYQAEKRSDLAKQFAQEARDLYQKLSDDEKVKDLDNLLQQL